MEIRNILTEHSREMAEPGVKWVQQYSPIISGIEVKPVPSEDQNFIQNLSTKKKTFNCSYCGYGPFMLASSAKRHEKTCKKKFENELVEDRIWSPITQDNGLVNHAPPVASERKIDNLLQGLLPIRQDSGSVNNVSIPNDFKNKFVDENIKYNFAPVYEVKKPQDLITNFPGVHERELLPFKRDCGPVNNFAIPNGFINNVESVHKGNKFSCSLCNKTFNVNSSLKRHIASVHEGLEFSCSFCGETKKERFRLRKHILSSHGSIPGIEIIQTKTLKSERTPANGSSEFADENIKYNFAPVHEVNKPQDLITNLPEGLLPAKQDCGPVNHFATPNSFINNVASVHEGKKFSCSSCNLSFNLGYSLRRHVASVHEGKKFSCSLCNQNFSLNSSLKRHVESFHEGLKFSCSFCGQTCSQIFRLKKHISVSHGNNPNVKIIQIRASKSEQTAANAVQNKSLITQIDPGNIIRTNEQQPIANFDAKNCSPYRVLAGVGSEGALAPLDFVGSQKIAQREINNLLLGLLPIKQENGT